MGILGDKREDWSREMVISGEKCRFMGRKMKIRGEKWGMEGKKWGFLWRK